MGTGVIPSGAKQLEETQLPLPLQEEGQDGESQRGPDHPLLQTQALFLHVPKRHLMAEQPSLVSEREKFCCVLETAATRIVPVEENFEMVTEEEGVKGIC